MALDLGPAISFTPSNKLVEKDEGIRETGEDELYKEEIPYHQSCVVEHDPQDKSDVEIVNVALTEEDEFEEERVISPTCFAEVIAEEQMTTDAKSEDGELKPQQVPDINLENKDVKDGRELPPSDCLAKGGQESVLPEHVKRVNSRNNKVVTQQRCKRKKLKTRNQNKCGYCGKAFSNVARLKMHENVHFKEKLFKCDRCCKAFAQEGSLRRHKKRHKEESDLTCNTCVQVFNSPIELRRHIFQSHVGGKRYQCDVCGKSFSMMTNLTTHQRIHTGDRPYQCKHCGKTFNAPYNLSRHELQHTGEKPYKCSICGKAFNQTSSCKRHQESHAGAKPHQCDICKKNFTAASSLRRHKLIHSDAKPFKCNQCEKAFNQKGYLYIHLKTHYQGDPFRCEYCSKPFRRISYLRKHEKTHTRG